MRHVDLCSGIGGFALGFEWAGLSKPVLFCDIDPWCRKILAQHWPHVPIADDVKVLANDPIRNVPDCDILTAGYPCQPFSVAGKRKGTQDDRHIWPYIRRIVAQKRPAWAVFENVYGHISMGLDEVLADLENESYAARAFIVPACGVNAPHKRDRVWIIGRNVGDPKHNGSPSTAIKRSSQETSDNKSEGQIKTSQSERASKPRDSASMEGSTRADNVADTVSTGSQTRNRDGMGDDYRSCGNQEQSARPSGEIHVAYSNSAGLQGRQNARSTSQSRAQRDKQFARRSQRPDGKNWLPEPAVGRVANGIPRRVDRLRGLGNAIVPQIAEQIALTIRKVSE